MISVVPGPGDLFAIEIRDHVIEVDQKVENGGGNGGPTPVELFLAALTSCVAHYARHYLRRHHLPIDGLHVSCEWAMATNPNRVGSIDIELTVPGGVPPEKREALLAVAQHCTVHNSVINTPEMRIAMV